MKVFSSTVITTLLLVATNLAESGPGEQRVSYWFHFLSFTERIKYKDKQINR